jgi:NAD(P)H-dependent FMN reductase
MRTLILSSSLAPRSRSRILCREVEQRLRNEGVEVDFADLGELELAPVHRPVTKDMQALKARIHQAQNLVIGMGVHCYSISESLKMALDTCGEGLEGKFFGILCAAGGHKSYLSTQHLTQICMNEWRMIQLPRVVYATGKDFVDLAVPPGELSERLDQFAQEFRHIGAKLLG